MSMVALFNYLTRFVRHIHIIHLSVQGVGGGGLQAANGDKGLTEQQDEHNAGDTTNSEASVPGPLGQIFGNTGQFLQNIIQG